MCDELVLPFDSSSGGGLVFDKADGVRGARRMPRLLMNNQSISSTVEEDDYDFFQICVQLEQSFRFTVDVTHNSGNPDLYISFSQPWPYVGNSDIISANINREHINVSTTAEIVQEAMRVPGEMPSEQHAVPSVIFMSVFGRETSTYTITATLTPEFSKSA
ncbi:Hypothetical Protein FCC1311_061032 [Hondaea fermentalgiana]|uniref:Uncharacterized protein n=1 Tax=Hondaea fermentalgiana TaxID=2315210 RepID=A0A2R5GMM4_9STRA|nr:Hypothetical Protein FCC1311_061032 [Hondaea fermentalgiana]|eukprot:GBG29883.1 Hypothetical Protein FCC1311_061032 [Hondaea fermentalgiana]